MEAYGGECVCCGEKEGAFLSIDHVNNDGAAHRKELKGNRIYAWLHKNGYPKDRFRILCFNCNQGRRVNGGVCPHEEQRAAAAEAKPPKARPAAPVCKKPTLF